MARPRKVREGMSIFAKRINYLLGNGNISEFERKFGLAKSTIQRIFEGGEPTRPTLEAILKGTGCNPGWLVAGIGEPFEGGKLPVAQQSKKLPPSDAERWDKVIPFRHSGSYQTVGEAAGDTTGGSRAGAFGENDLTVWDRVEIPDDVRTVKVKGQSMSPLVLGDQYVFVGPEYNRGRITEDREIVIAEVKVVDEEQAGTDGPLEGVYCKRVTDLGDEWFFQSINPEGSHFTVMKSNCRLWPVLGVWFGGHGKPPKEDR